MPATKTYTFVPSTQIESAKVNQNFDDILAYLNTSVILKDASVAFTAVPSGPATNPTTASQLARKQYVDEKTGVLGTPLVKNSDSNATTTSVTDLGIDMATWTMPTIENGKVVRIKLQWPFSKLVSQGGDYPAEGGGPAEIWIRINGTNVQVHDLPITTSSFFANDNAGGGFEFLITTNNTYTAGTTMTCKVMGRRVATPGGVKLGGDASNSIFFYASVI